VVVDGHVFNEPWNGTAYFEQGAAIPIELIDHIELILGPGSVLYGGSAMLGVVNVVTKRASALKGPYVVAEGGLNPKFDRARVTGDFGRAGVGVGESFTLLGKPLEWTGQAEMYGQNGPGFEWAPQAVTNSDGTPRNFGVHTAPGVWGGVTRRSYGTSVPALYTRLDWNGFALMFRTAGYKRETPYTNNFNQYRGDFDDPRTNEHETWVSIDLQHRARFGHWSTLAHGYFDDYHYEQDLYEADSSQCSFPVNGTCKTKPYGRSRWLGAEGQATYDWFGDGKVQTMLGADGRVRRIAAGTQSIDLATDDVVGTLGAREVTEVAFAAYGQQRWSPIPKLHLNAGGRFDHDPRGGDRVSPRAAVSFDPWAGGTLKALYSEAFRAPSFYEEFYTDAKQPAGLTLKPEVVRSAEATIEQRVGRHRLMMGVFRSWWSDMIGLQALDDGRVQFQNSSRIDNWGYNARVDGNVAGVAYGLSITGAHTRRTDDSGEHPLPVAPQVFGNARLSYDLPGALPTVALAATIVGPRPADRALDGDFTVTPYAPAQARLRLTLSDAIKAVPGLSYRVSGELITKGDSAYVAGPIQAYDPTVSARSVAELAPVTRATAFATLHYDFGGP
jgi:outer membrane receptor protein involved in Fe transport